MDWIEEPEGDDYYDDLASWREYWWEVDRDNKSQDNEEES